MAKALLVSALTTTLCVGCAAPVTDDAAQNVDPVADEASIGAASAAEEQADSPREQQLDAATVPETAPSPPATAQDNDALVGVQLLDIPGWDGLVKRDPFTDAWQTGFASADGISMICDPSRETYPTGLDVLVTDLPALNANPVDVEFRVGRQEPQVEAWTATTGSGGSSIRVPDRLYASVLQAGRLAVRVDGHTKVIEWSNGDAVYEIMRECAGQ